MYYHSDSTSGQSDVTSLHAGKERTIMAGKRDQVHTQQIT